MDAARSISCGLGRLCTIHDGGANLYFHRSAQSHCAQGGDDEEYIQRGCDLTWEDPSIYNVASPLRPASPMRPLVQSPQPLISGLLSPMPVSPRSPPTPGEQDLGPGWVKVSPTCSDSRLYFNGRRYKMGMQLYAFTIPCAECPCGQS